MVNYLIKTKEKDRCRVAMIKFAQEFQEEYTKEIGKLRYRPIKKMLPLLTPVVLKEPEGIILHLPMKMPDFDKLRQLIFKFTGRMPDPKWKERTVKNLNDYLKEEDIEFDSIDVLED